MDEKKITLKDVVTTLDESAKLGIERGQERVQLKKQIANRIKELRKQNGYTQKTICDKLVINKLTYSGYETARNEIPIQTMVHLADLFNVSMDYLTCRIDNPREIIGEKQAEQKSEKDLESRIAKLEKEIKDLKA